MTPLSNAAAAHTRRRLATAIAAALLLPVAGAMAIDVEPLAEGQQVADGTALILDKDDYATTQDNQQVLLAKNGGTITAYIPATLVSSGAGASVAHAVGDNSTVTLIGSDVQAQGDAAFGLDARDGGKIEASKSFITTFGAGGHGVNVSGASATGGRAAVVLTDSHVQTIAGGAAALNVDKGAHASVAAGGLRTAGREAHAVSVDGSGSSTSILGADIATKGEQARGVFLRAGASAATVDIKGAGTNPATISTEGAHASGVDVDGTGNQLTLSNVAIGTWAEDAHGLRVGGSGNKVTARELSVSTQGNASVAVSNHGGDVQLEDAMLQTSGTGSHGLYAGQPSTTGPRPVTSAARVAITTTGDAAMGAVADLGGRMDVSTSEISVSGQDAAGFVIRNAGSEGRLSDSTVRAEGTGGVGLRVQDAGRMTGTGVDVQASGAGGAALLVSGVTPGQPASHVTVGASTLSATAGSAVHVLGGSSSIALDGVVLSGGEGAIRFADHTDNPLERGSISTSGTRILGDVIDVSTGRTVLDLDAASLLMGKTEGVDALTLSGNSRWDMAASSNAGDLVVSNSVIRFPDPGATGHSTLTVTGNYHGDNALLALNTRLDDDASLTDRMHVHGNTSGTTRLRIRNAGGAGAQTDNGIAVVTVDGASDGLFSLDGRAVAGAYEYFLHKGAKADPDSGDWYLRSELDPCPVPGAEGCPVDPPVVDPPVIDPPVIDPPVINPPVIDPPVGPGPRPDPIIRPEVGAYLALQALAVDAMRHSLHDRVGEPALDKRDGASSPSAGAWVRIQTDQIGFDVADQVEIRSRGNQLQVGSHLVHWGERGHGTVGIMASAVKGSVTAWSPISGYKAAGGLRGQLIGVYGTWYGDQDLQPGWYVDAYAQHGRFRHEVSGDALQQERYRTRANALSVEVGQAISMKDRADRRVLIEPQVQLSYADTPGTSHTEANGTQVLSREAGGLQTRVGVRVLQHATIAGQHIVQPFLTLNWYRHLRSNSMAFDGDVLSGAAPADVHEVKIGAQLQLGHQLTGWGQAAMRRGDSGYRTVSGQIGLKYSW